MVVWLLLAVILAGMTVLGIAAFLGLSRFTGTGDTPKVRFPSFFDLATGKSKGDESEYPKDE
jgi:hypothetical protein